MVKPARLKSAICLVCCLCIVLQGLTGCGGTGTPTERSMEEFQQSSAALNGVWFQADLSLRSVLGFDPEGGTAGHAAASAQEQSVTWAEIEFGRDRDAVPTDNFQVCSHEPVGLKDWGSELLECVEKEHLMYPVLIEYKSTARTSGTAVTVAPRDNTENGTLGEVLNSFDVVAYTARIIERIKVIPVGQGHSFDFGQDGVQSAIREILDQAVVSVDDYNATGDEPVAFDHDPRNGILDVYLGQNWGGPELQAIQTQVLAAQQPTADQPVAIYLHVPMVQRGAQDIPLLGFTNDGVFPNVVFVTDAAPEGTIWGDMEVPESDADMAKVFVHELLHLRGQGALGHKDAGDGATEWKWLMCGNCWTSMPFGDWGWFLERSEWDRVNAGQ